MPSAKRYFLSLKTRAIYHSRRFIRMVFLTVDILANYGSWVRRQTLSNSFIRIIIEVRARPWLKYYALILLIALFSSESLWMTFSFQPLLSNYFVKYTVDLTSRDRFEKCSRRSLTTIRSQRSEKMSVPWKKWYCLHSCDIVLNCLERGTNHVMRVSTH